jgi:hypothetical protein
MTERHEPEPERERVWWAWWQSHGQAHLTRLLREEWNPIGSAEVPASEYDSYATRLGGLLREGLSEDQLATFLADARTGAMGLPADPDEDRRVAAVVHAWYLEARRGAE